MYLLHILNILAGASFLQNAICSERFTGQDTKDAGSVLKRLRNLEEKFDAERKEWERERKRWKRTSQDMLSEIHTLRQRVDSLDEGQGELKPEDVMSFLTHLSVNPDHDLQLKLFRKLLSWISTYADIKDDDDLKNRKETAESAGTQNDKTKTAVTAEDDVTTHRSDAKPKTDNKNDSLNSDLPNRPIKHAEDSKPPMKHSSDPNQPIKHAEDSKLPTIHSNDLNQPIKRSDDQPTESRDDAPDQPITEDPSQPIKRFDNRPIERRDDAPDQPITEDPSQPIKRGDDVNAKFLAPVVSGMGQKLDQLMADFQAFKQSQTSSSTFVHWGSSSCPRTAQTVYSGVVGSGLYAYYGSATNYLCLTLSPVVGNVTMAGLYTQLYGSEYQTYQPPHHDRDALCAVCRTPKSTTIMIPGTNVCQTGWQKEYAGFLMAGYNLNPSGTEYVCVDPKMEQRDGGAGNQDGVDFFYTLTHCGSLPCPPYENAKVVTCVVCSK